MAAVVTRKSLFSIQPLLAQLPIVSVREGDNFAPLPTTTPLSDASPTNDTSAALQAAGLSRLTLANARVTSSFLCSTCAVAFDSAEELREHARSGWHQHNIRLTSQHKPTIDEHAYLALPAAQPSSSTASHLTAPQPTSASDDTDEEEKQQLSDDDEDAVTLAGAPRVSFSTASQHVLIWKSLLTHPRLPSSTSPFPIRATHYRTAFRELSSLSHIGVFLCLGGRFAAGLFTGADCIHHRTFARYTVRAKQGGSQTTNDAANSGHQAKSIGSSIRRKEAVRFREEVHEVMAEWRDEIAACQRIFLFAPSYNRGIFYRPAITRLKRPTTTDGSSDGNAGNVEVDVSWDKTDVRIRSIPFSVYRPTFAEVERVYKQLTTVEFVDRVPGEDEEAMVEAADSEQDERKDSEDRPAATAVPPAEPDLVLEAIDGGDLPALQHLFTSGYKRPVPAAGVTALVPAVYHAATLQKLDIVTWLAAEDGGRQDIDEQCVTTTSTSSTVCWTALHYACHHNLTTLALHLLSLHASPVVRDSRGLSAYNSCPAGDEGRDIRAAIRQWAADEGAESGWEWKEAGFQPAARRSAEEEEERKRALKEKEKARKAKAKQRQKEQKEEESKERQREEQERKEHAARDSEQRGKREEEKKAALAMEQAWAAREKQLAGMSDREKRAMAAERRMNVMKGGAAGTTGSTLERCALSSCGKPLVRVPFERLHYKYDTLLCLQQHRAELDKTGATVR